MKKSLLLPLLMLAGCTSLFFQPSRTLYRHPEELGLRYEAVKFPSLDGTEIAGLFLYSSKFPVLGTVMHFHGNGENMTSHFGYSFWLTAQGYNVFIFDYRGYGTSHGAPSETGAVKDGIAAINYVRSRSDVNPERLAVLGQSLGGAIAIAAAAQAPNNGNIKALVLESAFDSYRDIAEDVLSRNALTWPLQWPLSRLLISDREKPSGYIGKLPHCPILVIHGDADPVVPIKFGKKLFAELPEPKQFWEIQGGGHTEAFSRFGATYRKKLVNFLDDALKDKNKF